MSWSAWGQRFKKLPNCSKAAVPRTVLPPGARVQWFHSLTDVCNGRSFQRVCRGVQLRRADLSFMDPAFGVASKKSSPKPESRPEVLWFQVAIYIYGLCGHGVSGSMCSHVVWHVLSVFTKDTGPWLLSSRCPWRWCQADAGLIGSTGWEAFPSPQCFETRYLGFILFLLKYSLVKPPKPGVFSVGRFLTTNSFNWYGAVQVQCLPEWTSGVFVSRGICTFLPSWLTLQYKVRHILTSPLLHPQVMVMPLDSLLILVIYLFISIPRAKGLSMFLIFSKN